MAKLSTDNRLGVLHPRETLQASFAFSTNGAEQIIYCDAANTVSVILNGTFVGTFEVDGTIDGVNWTPIPIRAINAASTAYALNATTTGFYQGFCGQYYKVKIRCTSYTSGTATGVIIAEMGNPDDLLRPNITPLIVTATGAAGSAVTATLPAVTGLRHFITYLHISKFASALLTAGATPVLVTTTNLPGSPVFSLGAGADSQGTLSILSEEYNYALAASAQSAATTIVAPATTAVIWRINVGYYLGS